MRQVGLPHDVVDSKPISYVKTLASPFEPEVGIHAATDLFAGTRSYSIFPKSPPLPDLIAGVKHIVEPAERGLGAYPVECRISLEHTRKNDIRNKLGERTMRGR